MIFVIIICNNIETSHLLDIIDELNLEMIPNNTILVSFDIMNMYSSVDIDRGIATVWNAL